jgi:hypothetical protein
MQYPLKSMFIKYLCLYNNCHILFMGSWTRPKLSYLAYAFIVIALISILFGVSQAMKPDQHSDGSYWTPVEKAIGKNGTMLPGGVFKIDLTRSDAIVAIGDVRLKPAMAMDSWVSFMRMGDGAMVMGDLVLTEDEIGPMMDKLVRSGMNVTAIHNTLIGETPHVLDLHIEGQGDPVRMAETIHDALLLSGTPFGEPVQAPRENDSIDRAQLDRIMGYDSAFVDGIYDYQIPRKERIMNGGMEIPDSLDVATSLKFQPLSEENAAVTGDFTLTAGEVGPVTRALNENGMQVTAIHTHMLTESPRLYYLHFWGTGNAYELAKGLRAAILKTNSRT